MKNCLVCGEQINDSELDTCEVCQFDPKHPDDFPLNTVIEVNPIKGIAWVQQTVFERFHDTVRA